MKSALVMRKKSCVLAPVHTYDLQAMDSKAGFDKPPVIVLYSSTSGDEDV